MAKPKVARLVEVSVSVKSDRAQAKIRKTIRDALAAEGDKVKGITLYEDYEEA